MNKVNESEYMLDADQAEYSEKLDTLGKFLIQEIRDVCLGRLNGILDPSKSPYYNLDIDLHESLGVLGEDKSNLIKSIVTVCIDHTVSMLMASFEFGDEEVSGIGLSADGSDIRELKELGCNLQSLVDIVWIEKFSKYGERKPFRPEE
jgi:hypothetical protein